jgi:hypothetical protein
MDRDQGMEIEAQVARARLREVATRVRPTCGIRAHPLESVLGALAAGFIIGSSPKLTESLAEVVLRLARGRQL